MGRARRARTSPPTARRSPQGTSWRCARRHTSRRLVGSPKLARLVEIVEEAASTAGRSSSSRSSAACSDTVAAALDGLAMGPLTGSVSPAKRQQLVDEFTLRTAAAVLVSQIEAGGVGLNMQAASVVILTEPQWKPTTEEQAIARCHRMGQGGRSTFIGCSPRTAWTSGCSRFSRGRQRSSTSTSEERAQGDQPGRDRHLRPRNEKTVSQAEAERRIIEIERRRMGIEPVAADA